MSKTRFSTLVLSLALVLATAPAVVAQEEEAALAAYAIFREELLAMGVAEEDLAEATAYLESEAQAEMTDEADEVAEEVTEAEEEVQDEKDEAKEELEEEKEEVKEEVG